MSNSAYVDSSETSILININIKRIVLFNKYLYCSGKCCALLSLSCFNKFSIRERFRNFTMNPGRASSIFNCIKFALL